ncbi:RHS repeat protein, partial [Pantoea sp. B65]
MPGASFALFHHTPEIAVVDNCGLTVRHIRYQRHPDTPTTTDERITRHRYNLRGFLAQSSDPRLYDLQQLANLSCLISLTGQWLRTDSVDAGSVVTLNDIASRPVRSIHANGVTRSWQYQGASLPGRLLSITEQPANQAMRITDRFVWGENTQAEKDRNLAGQCARHYDTAGLIQTDSRALTGETLSETRRLLPQGKDADWQGASEPAWNDLLETESFITRSTADASGLPLTTTDAMGNRQRQAYTVAGQLRNSWLTLKGATEQVIVKSLTYSASGQKLREEHGNGVVTSYSYQPETQRLSAIKTARPPGHPAGARVLQDLRYQYDPLGNVLRIINDAEATRFWRNEKVVPENSYGYDSLYQLVSASGREMVALSRQSTTPPSASVPLPADSSAFAAYTRSYLYDRGGNLTRIRHSAPASGNNYTTDITVSTRSNRALISNLTAEPAQVEAFFTAGGQQTRLQPGQSLNWTARGELLQVTPVVRDGQPADHESYRYNSDSQRIIKTSVQKTGNSTQTRRALWLPRIELRSRYSGESLSEALQVISVGEAGRAQVRVLHWLTGKPDGISNNQLRYSYDNLVHSSELELDADGNIISQEEYYPYGGTAV